MIFQHSADIALAPAPIDPDWIVSGEPKARCAVLSSNADRGAWTVLWECTAGRFTWRYDIEETVYFLEGSVIIAAPGVPARRYGPGDSIHFERGSVATWEVEGVIRKVAFCRRAPPRPVAHALRIARGLERRLRGLVGARRSAGALAQA
jgi:hypothetical protein